MLKNPQVPAQPLARQSNRTKVQHTVLLYNPRTEFFTMPLGLLAVGSHLDRRRYNVVLIDGRLEEDPVNALLPHLDKACCLGVGVLSGPPIGDALRVSRAVKVRRPELPVVWGGWHPSLFARECLSEASVDITVQGQGEETLTEILDCLAQGRELAGVKGCAYRLRNGQPRLNPPRPQADINTFRPHDYRLIPVGRYFAGKGKRQLDYISSQGCRQRCAFCAEPLVHKRHWTGLEPSRVGLEVEHLWRAYDFEDLNFQDETFFTNPDRVEGIALEFLQRRLPITWATTLRADQGARLSESVWKLCKQSGLRRVLIGVESGSPTMLRRIRKDMDLTQVFDCAIKCRRHGIAAIFNFIVGFPGEQEADFRASLRVARTLRSMGPDFQTHFFYFKPYPGSCLLAGLDRHSYSLPTTLEAWAGFDFGNPEAAWVLPEKFKLVERLNFYQRLVADPT
jgi:radical SAM superfamily enzyme YgiQ (UPF0313 family)